MSWTGQNWGPEQPRFVVDLTRDGYADILGLINPGLFRIGDVLSAAGPLEFHAVPRFAPEQFASVRKFILGAEKLDGIICGNSPDKEQRVLECRLVARGSSAAPTRQ